MFVSVMICLRLFIFASWVSFDLSPAFSSLSIILSRKGMYSRISESFRSYAESDIVAADFLVSSNFGLVPFHCHSLAPLLL